MGLSPRAVKHGAQFSLERSGTVEDVGGVLLINPQSLAGEVQEAVRRWVAELSADDAKRASLAGAIKTDFAEDFRLAGA
ncbi:MAG TPA: hypothetical protein VGK54_14785 [Chloroflexota bacterium]